MGYSSHTVSFLWRSTRMIAALCAVIWLIASGMALFGNPKLSSQSPLDTANSLLAPAVLYLFPGVILFILAMQARKGRRWAAGLILLVSLLSLVKLVLLATSLSGPYFNQPLSCELPVLLSCAFLSFACVFAWEDLSDISRTRSRPGAVAVPIVAPAKPIAAPTKPVPPPAAKPKTAPPAKPNIAPVKVNPSSAKSSASPPAQINIPTGKSTARPGSASKPPPPSTSIPRPKPRRDEPPAANTPWS